MLNSYIKTSKLDLSIAFRFISIFAIVAGHFNFIHMPGGAYYLIFLSGFNFILFTVPKSNCLVDNSSTFSPSEFYSVYFSFLFKILLPTVIYTIFLYLVLGEFHIGGILMISNFYGPMYASGLSFWFIEVLVQIYLLFAVIFYANVKYFNFKKAPYISMLLGFVLTYFISFVCRILWDTSAWLDRFPHLMIYMFFGGALVALSVTKKQKLISSLIISVILIELISFPWNDRIIFLYIGAMSTLWVKYLTIPNVINKVITLCAMSSLFVYLTHFQSLSLIKKFNSDIHPAYVLIFAFFVGIALTRLWKQKYKLVNFSKKLLIERF
ncbi:hypothetical protein [Vibrio alfacsensis]|uniref:hypothetical protein n=1 Tax=Vibrio alfacsensis TaxID=1074311 RepID=UPI004067BFB6